MFSLHHREKAIFVLPCVAVALYMLGLAAIDYFQDLASLGTSLLLLVGCAALALAFRVAAVRVEISPTAMSGIGVFRGWVIPPGSVIDVVRDRRLFGWAGLTVTTGEGVGYRLPLLLCESNRSRLDAFRSELINALADVDGHNPTR